MLISLIQKIPSRIPTSKEAILLVWLYDFTKQSPFNRAIPASERLGDDAP